MQEGGYCGSSVEIARPHALPGMQFIGVADANCRKLCRWGSNGWRYVMLNVLERCKKQYHCEVVERPVNSITLLSISWKTKTSLTVSGGEDNGYEPGSFLEVVIH